MKRNFLSIAFLILAGSSYAQVAANSELKSLVNQSFGFFPKIREAQSFITIAEQKIDLAKTNDPYVSADASYNFVQPKIEIPFAVNGETKNLQFVPVHNVNAAVNANYTVLDFGRLKANVEKAKADLLYAKDNAENTKLQLAYQVANIYYGIVYIRKAIVIEDTVLNYLGENKRIIESKLKNGEAIKLDILNIQASIDAEENRKVDLQNALQKQINLLAYTTGVTASNGGSFDFEAPVKQPADALADAQLNAADFLVAKDKILQAQSDVEIAKNVDKPSLSLHGAAGFKNGYVPEIGEIRFNYAAGVTFSVPIYSGGKTKKQVQVATSVVRQNELSKETLSNNYKKDIDQALTDITTNMERIRNTAGQIELADAGKALAASRYINGVGTNLEITNASTNLQRAEFTRLQYEYQLCLAKIELARLSGYKFW